MHLTDAATDDSLRAVHIRGAGDDFCAGVDWVTTNSGETSPHRRPRPPDPARRAPGDRTRSLPSTCPSCAACAAGPPGWAAIWRWPPISPSQARTPSSGSRSSTADSARIRVRRGCSPGWSGVARAKTHAAARREGQRHRRRRLGSDPRCVDRRTKSTTAAEELLARLAAGPTVAIGLAKQAIHYGQHATLPQSMNQELSNLELSCRTKDFKEGLAAFRERATPTSRAGDADGRYTRHAYSTPSTTRSTATRPPSR